MRQYRNYVAGEWVESPQRFPDIDPADGRIVFVEGKERKSRSSVHARTLSKALANLSL